MPINKQEKLMPFSDWLIYLRNKQKSKKTGLIYDPFLTSKDIRKMLDYKYHASKDMPI